MDKEMSLWKINNQGLLQMDLPNISGGYDPIFLISWISDNPVKPYVYTNRIDDALSIIYNRKIKIKL